MEIHERQEIYAREMQRRISSKLKIKIVKSTDNTYTLVAMMPVYSMFPIETDRLPTHQELNDFALAFNKNMMDTANQQKKLIEQFIEGFKNIYYHNA